MVKKVITIINVGLLVWTTLLIARNQMFYLVIPMLLLNIFFSCFLSKGQSDAARTCFYRTGIYVVVNTYFAISAILESVNIHKNFLLKVMLAVSFVMITSLFTVIPCGITYYSFCILKSNKNNY